MCLVRYSCGPLLHLARIFNANFIFGGQRKRSPDARIGQSALAVSIKRYFDLDSAFNGRRIATGSLCSFFHSWKKLIAVEFVSLAGGADKAIACPTGELRGDRSARANVNGNGLLGTIIDGGVTSAVVLTLKCDKLLAPEATNQRNSFAQASQALFSRWPFDGSDRHFVERFAGANAQDHASGVKHAEGPKSLRYNGRLIAKSRCQHAGAEQDATGSLANRTKPGKSKWRMSISMPPGLGVVADPDAIKPTCFCFDGEIQQFSWPELLR